VAASDEGQSLIESLLGLLGFMLGGVEPALGADTLLLGLEDVLIDAIPVEQLE
jgi:hypothetical protein